MDHLHRLFVWTICTDHLEGPFVDHLCGPYVSIDMCAVNIELRPKSGIGVDGVGGVDGAGGAGGDGGLGGPDGLTHLDGSGFTSLTLKPVAPVKQSHLSPPWHVQSPLPSYWMSYTQEKAFDRAHRACGLRQTCRVMLLHGWSFVQKKSPL